MKFLKHFSFALCILVLLSNVNVYGYPNTDPNLYLGFYILDTYGKTPLPDRFRIIPSLNISGSAQFVPSQLDNIKKAISKPDIYILDLRQESHGFINDIALSFFSPERLLNNGFSSQDTLAEEIKLFKKLKIDSVENIFNKRAKFIESLTVKKSSIEQDVVQDKKMNYALFATRDGFIPTITMTDSFVDFIKIIPENTHLHFHCDAGEGRTTMYMSMFQMMKESTSKSLEEILKEQLDAGGIVLTDDKTRADFLTDFYNYTKANSSSNFKMPFSIWAKSNSQTQ